MSGSFADRALSILRAITHSRSDSHTRHDAIGGVLRAHTRICTLAHTRSQLYSRHKARERLLGSVEGQYKIRGETIPLAVRKQSAAELEETLKALRESSPLAQPKAE